jgi:hypothetical protein
VEVVFYVDSHGVGNGGLVHRGQKSCAVLAVA